MPHAKMRAVKHRIAALLAEDNWRNGLEDIAAYGLSGVGPLFSFLPREPETRHRAAVALGLTVAGIAQAEPEAAKNIARRFMWHMNEESGNIGWGIPEAFAECLAASPVLAETYAGILVSYIMDLGHDDNYCDNDLLRRSCYWAVGRLAQARPALAEKARPWLLKGLAERDGICRGMAAWALAQLPPDLMNAPALLALANSNGNNDICEIFDGREMTFKSVKELARLALGMEAASCHA